MNTNNNGFRVKTSYGLILMAVLMVLCTGQGMAQQIHTRMGFGYYDPRIGGDTGNIFYTDLSIKLPTEYYLGIGFGLSDIFTSYRSDEVPLFAGFRTIRNFYHFRFNIQREFFWGVDNGHVLRVGPGLTYIQMRYAEPFVFLNAAGTELTVGNNLSNRDQDDAGLLFNVDYSYRFSRIEIGLHTEAHLLLDVGLGGLIVAPQVGFAF